MENFNHKFCEVEYFSNPDGVLVKAHCMDHNIDITDQIPEYEPDDEYQKSEENLGV